MSIHRAIIGLAVLAAAATGAHGGAAHYHYLGPWVWQTTPFPCWTGPEGTLGVVDLRTLADQAATGPTARGVGFFCTDRVLPAPYVALGSDLNAPMAAAAVAGWRAALGWEPAAPATPLSALWEALTERSDGILGARPLDPTIAGNLDLRLGGHSLVKSERFERKGNHWGQIKRMRQAEYKELRKAAQKGKTQKEREHHRRVMTSWVRVYGCDYHDLLGGEPDEAPLLPETTITESFNTGNSDTLGPDLTWSETAGDWDIVSNMAQLQTSGGNTHARAQSDLSSSNHYAQVDFASTSTHTWDHIGACARFASAASTFYVTILGKAGGTGTIYQYKCVATSYTLLGSTACAMSLPDTIKTRANGSTITSYFNGTSKLEYTDSAISGGTRCGIHGYYGADKPSADNFEASDLAAAGPSIPVLEHHRRQQQSRRMWFDPNGYLVIGPVLAYEWEIRR